MKRKDLLLFSLLSTLLVALFFADLVFGSIDISLNDTWKSLTAQNPNLIIKEIIINFRLPKAITAILTGAALSVSGLMLQTLFRNPLADPYILGVSSGASLGVALTVMSGSLLSFAFASTGWVLILSATVGASLVLLLVIAVSFRVQSVISLLIVGIMFGIMASAIVNVIQNFSNPDSVKLFVMWTFGSLSAVSWSYMQLLLPVILIGLGIAFLLKKNLNALLLGENNARALGVNITQTRLFIILSSGLLAGGVTAFVGPIAFIGIAVPHLSRGIFRSSNHALLIPACMLLGACILLLCDMISQLSTYTLPINTVSALFGAPIIIWIVIKSNSSYKN